MRVGFVAYIDESGDPGIQRVRPLTPGGASEWLVLCCFLVRIEQDRNVGAWTQEIMGQFRNRQRPDLHFTDLLPAKKIIACNE
jgi:hypothetical protein